MSQVLFGINTYLLSIVLLKRSVILSSICILLYSIFVFDLCSVITFLGAFAKLRKATISFMFVRPSVRPHGTTRLPLTDFHEIWYLSIFRKSVDRTQVFLKTNKNKIYFTWRPIYIFDHMLLIFFPRMRYISDKNCRGIGTYVLCQ